VDIDANLAEQPRIEVDNVPAPFEPNHLHFENAKIVQLAAEAAYVVGKRSDCRAGFKANSDPDGVGALQHLNCVPRDKELGAAINKAANGMNALTRIRQKALKNDIFFSEEPLVSLRVVFNEGSIMLFQFVFRVDNQSLIVAASMHLAAWFDEYRIRKRRRQRNQFTCVLGVPTWQDRHPNGHCSFSEKLFVEDPAYRLHGWLIEPEVGRKSRLIVGVQPSGMIRTRQQHMARVSSPYPE